MLKPRKCKNCKQVFNPFDSINCCSMSCALDYLDKAKQKKLAKEHARQKTDFYQQSIQWQHTQCKLSFNKMRRLEELKWFYDRGIEPYCISCHEPLGGDEWCCGHFKTVAAKSGLRYDRMNTYLQHNVRCNKNLSGDIGGTKTTPGYIKGLYLRFGDEEADRIINYCETQNGVVKWAWQEMKILRQEWNAKKRELEKYLALKTQ